MFIDGLHGCRQRELAVGVDLLKVIITQRGNGCRHTVGIIEGLHFLSSHSLRDDVQMADITHEVVGS